MEEEHEVVIVGWTERLSIRMYGSSTVHELYGAVIEATGRLRSGTRLFFDGSCLRDPAERLADLGIGSGSVVHAVFRQTPVEVTCVLQVWPAHGPEAGGVLVHIYGRDFRETAQLCARFGSTVTPAQFKSAHLLTCIAPAHPPGVVAVEVSTDGANFTSDSKGLFTYHGRRSSVGDGIACPVDDACIAPVHAAVSQPPVVPVTNLLG